jgi:hypothetical protein
VKSKTYVVSWDRVYKNSLDVDSQLFRAGLDYLVYNDSSMPELNSNWVRAKKVFFLGHFYNSLKDFIKTDYPVFIFNAGDAVYSDHAELTIKAESILISDPDCWAYAPSTDGTDVWSWDGSSIVASQKHPGLHLSTHTNAIWVALSRDLVDVVFKFFEWMFENNHFDREFKKINTGVFYLTHTVLNYFIIAGITAFSELSNFSRCTFHRWLFHLAHPPVFHFNHCTFS